MRGLPRLKMFKGGFAAEHVAVDGSRSQGFKGQRRDEVAGRSGQRDSDPQPDFLPAAHQFRCSESRNRTADAKMQTLARKGAKTQMGFHAFLPAVLPRRLFHHERACGVECNETSARRSLIPRAGAIP